MCICACVYRRLLGRVSVKAGRSIKKEIKITRERERERERECPFGLNKTMMREKEFTRKKFNGGNNKRKNEIEQKFKKSKNAYNLVCFGFMAHQLLLVI